MARKLDEIKKNIKKRNKDEIKKMNWVLDFVEKWRNNAVPLASLTLSSHLGFHYIKTTILHDVCKSPYVTEAIINIILKKYPFLIIKRNSEGQFAYDLIIDKTLQSTIKGKTNIVYTDILTDEEMKELGMKKGGGRKTKSRRKPKRKSRKFRRHSTVTTFAKLRG
jgi:hypothetical protein